MNSVGERIKKARLSQGLSQVELAKTIQVSQPTVANWENGSHIPRQNVLEHMAKFLNTPLYVLLGGEQDREGYAHISRQYLNTPIRHVPILTWPNCQDIKEHEIEAGVALDYLTISTSAQKPFALIVNEPNLGTSFPIGTIIIFDAKIESLTQDGYYLFVEDQNIVLRQWQQQNALSKIKSMPLAKVLFSIRKH